MRFAALALVVALGLAGCATGTDVVATGGGFEFVAPGGQQIIFYDPPETRGTLTSFSGESLARPAETVGVQSHPGKIVIINVWGSWCAVCRAEMADLQYVHDQLAGSGAVLGVDIRDDRESARDFLRGVGVTYDSIYDQPGRVLFQLAGYPRNVVPSTIVLDRQHRVAAVYLTRVPLANLMSLTSRLRAEPVPPP